MRYESSNLFKLLLILVFLFCIHNLFPQSDRTKSTKIYKQRDAETEIRSPKKRSSASVESFHPEIEIPSKSKIKNFFSQSARTELIKIYKQRDADIEILYSPQIKIVQELKTCFIAHVKSGFSSSLSLAGFNFEHLDDDIKDKKYYLVYCPSSEEAGTLKYYGDARLIEENLALFWSDKREAREILPAHFQISRLPSEPLHSFKKRSLVLVESFYPEIEFPSRFEVDRVILDIVNQVSKQNLTDYVQNLQDFQTRFASTSNCELAGDYIYDFFIQSGIEAEYDSFSFASYSSNNIVGTLEGQVDPSQIVVICAHYDSVSDQSYTLAPGADDNASGTAAVMEASRIFADQSFDFTVKFICFSAEEWGLYGSKDYAREARQRGEDIIAVINLDMIAYTDSLPEDLDIISNPASEWLANKFFATSITYTPLLDIFKIVNSSFIWSDHSPFWNSGYSAICGIEDAPPSNPYYHTTNDTIDTLNLDFTTEVVKASLATVAELAQPVSTPQTPVGFTSRSQIISSLFSSIKTAFLSWDSNQDPVIGYNIYRTTTSHSDYQKLNNSPLAQTYYMDQSLDSDTPYYYVLTAVDSLGNESNYSKEVVDDEGNENTNSVEGRAPSRNMLRTILAIRKINPWI